MNYASLTEIMHDMERRIVALGVPAAVAATELMRAEAKFITALAECARAERQLILDLKSDNTAAIARKHQRSPRTIRRWKLKALNKIGNLRAVP